MAGTLYIVATPIGNTEDMTDRAKRILSGVNFIASEDTRAAGLLLKSHNIENKLISYHKFNEKSRESHIVSELERGMDVAVISDAGTPCISDPGWIVVRAAAERGIRVTAVCGASAVTAALSISGFQFDAFSFFGFLPRTVSGLEKLASELVKNRVAVSVFYESPKRIKKSLAVLDAIVPEASLCLCNDLTKQYERVYRGSPRQVMDKLLSNPSAEKGEYTLVLYMPDVHPGANVRGGAGSGDGIIYRDIDLSILSPEALITEFMVKSGGSIKDAVNFISQKRVYKKKTLYEAAIKLKNMFDYKFTDEHGEKDGAGENSDENETGGNND
jgi:16S rRNA (cytidine1402-2'-O)-methyltransferase